MSLQDDIFVEEVENDITLFSKDARRKRVLVFPPVNNYRRFLIHQWVQEHFGDILKTFSIGQGLARRTVVCYQSDFIRDYKLNGVPSRTHDEPVNSSKLDSVRGIMGFEGRRSPSDSPESSRMRQVKSTPAVEIYRPPAARRASRKCPTPSAVTTIAETSAASAKVNRQRKPDRAVYVPKHRRSTETDDGPHYTEQVVSSGRSRSNRPEVGPSCENHPSRESSSANNFDGNQRDLSESWNKLNSSSSSSSSSSTESCSKNCEHFEKVSTEVSLDGDELHREEIHQDDKVLSEYYSNSREMSELAENPPVTNQLLVDSTPCLSVDSDELVNSETGQSVSTYQVRSISESASCDLVGDDRALDDAIRHLDEEIARVSSSSSTTSLASSHRNKIERLDSADSDDQTNKKNLETSRSHGVSKILIISDTKQEESQEKSMKVDKEAVANLSEKKPKKVARAKSKPASPPSLPIKLNRDECDWDSLFDDNGECLDPTLIEELTAAVGEVTIQQPKNDYKAFSRPVEVSNEEFGHVIEIYNFPSDFKTSDLAAVFSPWKNGGFELKWIDDTHCLGVFSSPLVAAEVLSSDHPFVKTRPLSAATALSKTKARKSAESLQPYKSRPETCTAMARRLITGALGVRLATARQEREQEKVLLREAKEKRRLANKQQEDVWEGIIDEK